MERIPLLIASALTVAVAFSTPRPAAANMDCDNTKMNKQEQVNGNQTADQQGENAGDRKITQEIRRAVMKNKSLSVYAHNVKI